MVAQSELSIGFKKESTYGTGVTVDRWLEFLPNPSLNYTYNTINSKGLRVGSNGVTTLSKRVRTTSQGAGDIEFELVSKGMGTLFEALLGSGTSTLVSGTTYQQLFTLSTLPSLTIQQGLVLGNAAGDRDSQTWTGCVSSGFEIAVPNGDYATVKTSWDIRNVDTATPYAAPSYAASPYGFHWGIAAATLGGSPTAPTTTALASGGTQVSNVKSVSIKVDHALSGDRYAMGSPLKKQPTAGIRTITGSIEVEHDSSTMRAAYLADTTLPLVLTMTTTESLSTGFSTFQVYVPGVKLVGTMPTSAGGQVPTVTYNFEAGYDGTNAAVAVALRTADTAL